VAERGESHIRKADRKSSWSRELKTE